MITKYQQTQDLTEYTTIRLLGVLAYKSLWAIASESSTKGIVTPFYLLLPPGLSVGEAVRWTCYFCRNAFPTSLIPTDVVGRNFLRKNHFPAENVAFSVRKSIEKS